jgi:Flp pilus assembly pilin Flp
MLKLIAFTAPLGDRLAQLRNEEGQTMAEYGVVLALITLAVIGAMMTLSGNIAGAFSSVAAVLP